MSINSIKNIYRIPIFLMLTVLVSIVVSCNGRSAVDIRLDEAESLMELQPDSALTILSGIDKVNLQSKEEKARYALLMSMALDKNYIDTTTFDVIQPAIDYYLDNGKGSPDDRLRTYYYQGCIFLNKGEKDNALNSFIKGLDNIKDCKDSLCMARTLVAQALLYKDFYDFASYTNSYLKAANIYKNKNVKNLEFDCLLNALNGTIILKDKHRADSLMNICNRFTPINNTQNQTLQGYRLSHTLIFGSSNDLKNLIDNPKTDIRDDANGILNLAYAYNKLGNNHKAKQLLSQLNQNKIAYDTLKYQYIYVSILEDLGEYKDAFSVYRDFSLRLDSINILKFDQKAQSIEERHQLELKSQIDARKKSKIIIGCIGGIIFFAMVAFISYLLALSNKAKRDLAIQKSRTTALENERLKSEKDLIDQKAKASQYENEKLKSEKEKLYLENRNLQLERDKKILEAENLAHRVETLENESESLKNLMAQPPEEIPVEVQTAIKVRIEMLNSLLAGYITANAQYEKPYDVWVKELTENTEEFMNSNRLAFQVSHPRFIQYFDERGLTTDEINYVCLYAIGLRGKEVGNYMKKRSHVNISSAIRKKLGIDKHETNIGIYVRKLLKSL